MMMNFDQRQWDTSLKQFLRHLSGKNPIWNYLDMLGFYHDITPS
jgi:hypothetical protein